MENRVRKLVYAVTIPNVLVETLRVLAPLMLCKEGRVILGEENYLRQLLDYLESSDSTILGLGVEILECLTLDRIGGELFLPMLEKFHRLLTSWYTSKYIADGVKPLRWLLLLIKWIPFDAAGLLESPQSFKLQAICVLKNVGIINEGVQRMIEAGIVDQLVEILPALTKSYSTVPALPLLVEESRATSSATSTEQGLGSGQTSETLIFLQNLSRLLCKICQVGILKENRIAHAVC